MNKNCTEYLDNISVLFNTISRDKKTMFDEFVRGIGEFVREDDYDYYDFLLILLMVRLIIQNMKYLKDLIVEIWKIWNEYVNVFKKKYKIEKKNL